MWNIYFIDRNGNLVFWFRDKYNYLKYLDFDIKEIEWEKEFRVLNGSFVSIVLTKDGKLIINIDNSYGVYILDFLKLQDPDYQGDYVDTDKQFYGSRIVVDEENQKAYLIAYPAPPWTLYEIDFSDINNIKVEALAQNVGSKIALLDSDRGILYSVFGGSSNSEIYVTNLLTKKTDKIFSSSAPQSDFTLDWEGNVYFSDTKEKIFKITPQQKGDNFNYSVKSILDLTEVLGHKTNHEYYFDKFVVDGKNNIYFYVIERQIKGTKIEYTGIYYLFSIKSNGEINWWETNLLLSSRFVPSDIVIGDKFLYLVGLEMEGNQWRNSALYAFR